MTGRLQACLAALLAVAFASAWHEQDALGAGACAFEEARATLFLAPALTPEQNHDDGTSWAADNSVAEDPSEDDESRRPVLALAVAFYVPRPVSTSLPAEWLGPHAGSLRRASFTGLPRGPPFAT